MIISATKGLEEYRQIHLAENNPRLWPAINGVETRTPTDRKVDGMADVTLKNVFSLFNRYQRPVPGTLCTVNLTSDAC